MGVILAFPDSGDAVAVQGYVVGVQGYVAVAACVVAACVAAADYVVVVEYELVCHFG